VGDQQLSLEPTAPLRRAKTVPAVESLAQADPVALVAVDVTAAQVDRFFEYLVPSKLDELARVGCRVRVRFAGRLVNGFIRERIAEPTHTGKLSVIKAVLGPSVLSPAIADLSRAVADRYAGTFAEVVRDAVPPRLKRVEAKFSEADFVASEQGEPAAPCRGVPVEPGIWATYEGSSELLGEVADHQASRASLVVCPTDDPVLVAADLIARAGSSGIVIVPDGRDRARFEKVFDEYFGDRLAVLSANDKPAKRYREFLRIRTGQATVVLGTRNAVFAPVVDCPLIFVWDDSDDSLSEPRSPGWHAREVAALRTMTGRCTLVVASHSRSVNMARLVDTGWARSVVPTRDHRREAAKVITRNAASNEDPDRFARIPHIAWQVIKTGIKSGPVLVQVARSGYLPGFACVECRTPAQCPICSGPLALTKSDEVACRWCADVVQNWSCAECGDRRMRAMSVGSQRTAEELRRAFPAVEVLVSGSLDGILDVVPDNPAIVVATVGAEPVAVGGYQTAVLLDGGALLARSDLRSEEETMRRWFNVAALVKPAGAGGQLAVTADPSHRAVQALVRMNPAAWARRELQERFDTGLPPTTRCASITGKVNDINDFMETCRSDHRWNPQWRCLGPVAVTLTGHAHAERMLILGPHRDGALLAALIKSALVAGTARTGAHAVRVRIDPVSLY